MLVSMPYRVFVNQSYVPACLRQPFRSCNALLLTCLVAQFQASFYSLYAELNNNS